jgi:hypothetical protein
MNLNYKFLVVDETGAGINREGAEVAWEGSNVSQCFRLRRMRHSFHQNQTFIQRFKRFEALQWGWELEKTLLDSGLVNHLFIHKDTKIIRI